MAFADAYKQCIASHQNLPGTYKLRDQIDPDAEPIDIARVYTLKSLGAVMQSLSDLPEFRSDKGAALLPLHDLAQALMGLDGGRHSALLETRKVGSRTKHPIEGGRQAMAVALVEFFERAGLKNVDARKEVARILGDAGFVGRKGGPISPQTLFEWQVQITGEEEGSPRRELLAEYRSVLMPDNDWKPSREEARNLARAMTTTVLFESQI